MGLRVTWRHADDTEHPQCARGWLLGRTLSPLLGLWEWAQAQRVPPSLRLPVCRSLFLCVVLSLSPSIPVRPLSLPDSLFSHCPPDAACPCFSTPLPLSLFPLTPSTQDLGSLGTGHPLPPSEKTSWNKGHREILEESSSPKRCLGLWEKPGFRGPSHGRNLGPRLGAGRTYDIIREREREGRAPGGRVGKLPGFPGLKGKVWPGVPGQRIQQPTRQGRGASRRSPSLLWLGDSQVRQNAPHPGWGPSDGRQEPRLIPDFPSDPHPTCKGGHNPTRREAGSWGRRALPSRAGRAEDAARGVIRIIAPITAVRAEIAHLPARQPARPCG